MKKTILGSMFLYLGGFIGILIAISTLVLLTILYIADPTESILIPVIIIYTFLTPYLVYLSSKQFIQWIRIDGEYIMSKNIFGTIKKVHIDDIKEVKLMKIDVSTSGSKLKWIVIFTEVDEKMTKGLNEKNSPIYVKYTKKHLKIIEKFLGKPVDRN
ncbi:MAG: hypothetical protein ACLFRI_05545 [Candidatus Izemoplasmataceae bacterium]